MGRRTRSPRCGFIYQSEEGSRGLFESTGKRGKGSRQTGGRTAGATGLRSDRGLLDYRRYSQQGQLGHHLQDPPSGNQENQNQLLRWRPWKSGSLGRCTVCCESVCVFERLCEVEKRREK